MDKMKTLSDGIKTYEIYDANALHKNEEGKVSEDLNLGTHKILEVGDPVEDGDGVNKKYVDGIDVSEKDITFEIAAKRANVQSGDSLAVAFGKLARYCADLKPHAFADPVNNLLGTDPELPLAAPMGTELKRLLDELNGKLILKPITPSIGVAGRVPINLPENIDNNSSIHVIVQWTDDNGNTYRQVFDLNFLADLSERNAFVTVGGYHSDNYYEYCQIVASRKSIMLNALVFNGENKANSAKIFVSYR